METLKSYLEVIDSRLLAHISGKPKEFIESFLEGDYLSEEAFMTVVCGKKKERKYYQNLKSKTLKILQALAFVSTEKGANPVKKKFDICQRKFFAGRKFIAEKNQNEGARLIRQAYRIAKEYHFIYLACEMSNILYKHYIYYEPNKKKATVYAEEMRAYMRDYMIDRQAEDIYLQYISNKKQGKDSLDAAIRQLHNLEGESLRYLLYRYILNVLKGFEVGVYSTVIDSCTIALNRFKGKKGVYASHYQYFYTKMAIAQMVMGQHDTADANLLKASAYAPRKSHNDYLIRLYRTINALHCGAYQQAYVLYKENVQKCKFETIRQQFAIIEAYLYFLSRMGYLQLERRFRLGKYLNENILSKSDKRGDNISIMIARLLLYLVRDRAKFIDCLEAISNYSYRHLKSRDTQRAKRFIQILCLLPRVDFDFHALNKRAEPHIAFLNEVPVSIGQNITIVEVLPYHTILSMFFEYFQEKVA